MKDSIQYKSLSNKKAPLWIGILLLALCLGISNAQAQRRRKKTTQKKTVVKKAIKKAPTEKPSQDTVPLEGGKNFTVTSDFTPSLKPASKINFSSTTALPTPEKTPLNYNVPAQNLTFTYNPAFLRPLAVNIDTGSVWRKADFVKLGYGNYSTPYLEGGFSLGDGYHSAVTIHAKHTSSKGNLPLQEFGKTGIEASGVFAVSDKNELDARAYFNNNKTYAYGGLLPNQPYNKDSLKRNYHDVGIKLGLSNKFKNATGIDYHPTIGIDAFGDNHDGRESTLSIDAPFSKRLNETFVAKLGAGIDVSSFKKQDLSINNNLVTIRPSIEINRPDFKMNLGIIPSFYNSDFHLMPNLSLEAKMRDERFIAMAGWKGYYNKNTYRSLTTFNPWIAIPQDFDYTRVSEIYGGFKGTAGDHLTFNATVAYLNEKDAPLFLNREDDNLFDVISDDINNLRFHGELGFNAKQSFSLLAGVTLNNYSKATEQAWGMSPIEMNGSLRWRILPAVLLKSDLDIWTGGYYKDPSAGNKKLSGAADWNVGAEVDIIKNVGLWLQVNNLLNNKYQRFYNYQTIGANIMGGIIFNFGQLKK